MHTDISGIPLEMELDGIETRGVTCGDVIVRHIDLPAGVDFTPLFKGLPDDRCQCPHWGYQFAGTQTYYYPDREEVVEAGSAFYAPPGHTASATAGSEFLVISPADQLRETEAAMASNMQALQQA